MSKAQSVVAAIRRTPYQSLSAIILTTLTFFSLSVFTLVVLGTQQLLSYFESRPQVTAFFRDSATEADAAALKTKLTSAVIVESATYVSKDDALKLYQDQNRDNPLLLEMVTADILPSSLEVSARSVDELESVATIMQQDPTVEEVVFQKDVIDTLRKWLGGIRTGGLILTTLLMLAATLTLIVIIGLKFRSKKTEMYTLTLLGATHGYIRRPFVAEATIYALVGAVFGWGSAYLSLLYLTPNLISFFGEIQLLPVPPWVMLSMLGSQLVLGILLGLIASLIATRRAGR